MRKLAYALLVLCAGCLSEPKPAGGGDGGADDDGGNRDGGDGDAAGPPRVVEIATGFAHTCARISDGRVRCWGQNTEGELGYGNSATANRIGDNETPASAGDVPVGGEVKQIVAGNSFTCALLMDGNVRCWGRNGFGQDGAGLGTTVYGNDEPASDAPLAALGAPALQISAGANHVCALLDAPGGDVLCWGDGAGPTTNGTLGYPNDPDVIGTSIGDDETPTAVGPVPAANLDLTNVVAGFLQTCAVIGIGGAVECWGDDSSHQLGYPDGVNRIGDNETPITAGTVNVGAAVRRMFAGQNHTCALRTDNSLTCWGFGGSGALGYGNPDTIGDGEAPMVAGTIALNADVLQVITGSNFTCALLDKDDDEVRCWGTGLGGKLGLGSPNDVGDNELPTAVPPVELGGPVQAISVSNGQSGHTCAILTSGEVRCWGSNDQGQLGYVHTDTIGDTELPTSQSPVEIL